MHEVNRSASKSVDDRNGEQGGGHDLLDTSAAAGDSLAPPDQSTSTEAATAASDSFADAVSAPSSQLATSDLSADASSAHPSQSPASDHSADASAAPPSQSDSTPLKEAVAMEAATAAVDALAVAVTAAELARTAAAAADLDVDWSRGAEPTSTSQSEAASPATIVVEEQQPLRTEAAAVQSLDDECEVISGTHVSDPAVEDHDGVEAEPTQGEGDSQPEERSRVEGSGNHDVSIDLSPASKGDHDVSIDLSPASKDDQDASIDLSPANKDDQYASIDLSPASEDDHSASADLSTASTDEDMAARVARAKATPGAAATAVPSPTTGALPPSLDNRKLTFEERVALARNASQNSNLVIRSGFADDEEKKQAEEKKANEDRERAVKLETAEEEFKSVGDNAESQPSLAQSVPKVSRSVDADDAERDVANSQQLQHDVANSQQLQDDVANSQQPQLQEVSPDPEDQRHLEWERREQQQQLHLEQRQRERQV